MMERLTTPPGQVLALGASVATLAFLCNAFLPVPMFGDFWLHIGQSLSLLALLLFGLPIALVSAAAAGLGIVWAAGQWSMAPLMIFEILVVAALIARGLPMILAATAFWLVVGLPLCFFLLPIEPDSAQELLTISVIKLGMNGLLNAALASALFLVIAPKIGPSPLGSRQMTLPRQAFSMNVTLVVLPSLAIALFLVSQAIDAFSSEVEDRLAQQAQVYSLLTELHLDRHLAAIQALAERHSEGPGPAIAAELDGLDRAHPGFLTLVVVDREGLVVHGYPADFFARVQDAPLAVRDVSDRDWFVQARETRRPYLSDGFIGRGFGNDPIVAVSAPLLADDGRFLGVVEGSLSLPRFGDLEAVEDDTDLMLILDAAGHRIHAPESLAIAPLAAVTMTPVEDRRLSRIDQVEIGRQRFFVAEARTSQGWRVYALSRSDSLVLPVLRFVLAFGFGLLLLVGLGGWAARIFAGRISQPLSILSDQVLDRERATIELPPSQRTSPEIVRVSRALDQARRLALDFQHKLEREVAEKTTQLRELNRRLGVMALGDPLTGLLNRRGFEVKAQAFFERAAEKSQGLVLAMIDIDHFKKINDSFGHAVGDQCLRAMAERLRDAFSQHDDLIARLGGEEFVLMILTEAPDEAIERLEEFRRAMAAAPIALDDREIGVAISIGTVAVNDCAGVALGQLLERADQALYLSKERGRNRLTRSSMGQ